MRDGFRSAHIFQLIAKNRLYTSNKKLLLFLVMSYPRIVFFFFFKESSVVTNTTCRHFIWNGELLLFSGILFFWLIFDSVVEPCYLVKSWWLYQFNTFLCSLFYYLIITLFFFITLFVYAFEKH